MWTPLFRGPEKGVLFACRFTAALGEEPALQIKTGQTRHFYIANQARRQRRRPDCRNRSVDSKVEIAYPSDSSKSLRDSLTKWSSSTMVLHWSPSWLPRTTGSKDRIAFSAYSHDNAVISKRGCRSKRDVARQRVRAVGGWGFRHQRASGFQSEVAMKRPKKGQPRWCECRVADALPTSAGGGAKDCNHFADPSVARLLGAEEC